MLFYFGFGGSKLHNIRGGDCRNISSIKKNVFLIFEIIVASFAKFELISNNREKHRKNRKDSKRFKKIEFPEAKDSKIFEKI